MALTNAQRQARWCERNRIVLSDDADEIATKLIRIDIKDRPKLRKVFNLLAKHLMKATRGGSKERRGKSDG
jgi:hypothetical protein